MEYAIVVYSSVTVANRAKKLLLTQTGYAGVIQIPAELGIKGCNYSVRCYMEDLSRLMQISHENNLKIRAVFRETTVEGQKVYEKYDLS